MKTIKTIRDVRERVKQIREIAGDEEAAHGAEDRLWADVLRAIADGHPNARGIAATALETQQIDFHRYCA